MIFIPIFMPMPQIGYATISKEDQERVQANRDDVLNVLIVNPQGLTIQEIARKTNKEVRKVNAILTVLKCNGQVESEFIDNGKVWRARYERI